ncbi:N-(5'-phosphoribosyl)anthranilate isomerase [Tenacibaculum sp. 190524A05c]|uniref:N-(5'-phosphoribosyl)anthranilate isomerase n=2 Tax=Tenacibaculum platacis TaxID=3137852 RepID=A0ABP1EEK0_9FLAO
MKYVDNIRQVAELKPDYLGFIFYERSKRNFEGIIPEIPKGIKKTGVFVNEYLEILVSLAEEYKLEAIQLHGDESVAYIQEIKKHLPKVEIIKVFGIKDTFDFSILEAYESVVDYFLFDTKGKERGGNGVVFDWTVLKNYPSTKPFFLSGGIGLQEVPDVLAFLRRQESQYCVALDINSKFETEPGLKSIKKLKKFKNEI